MGGMWLFFKFGSQTGQTSLKWDGLGQADEQRKLKSWMPKAATRSLDSVNCKGRLETNSRNSALRDDFMSALIRSA